MASSLPLFPRFVFTIFEPISLLGGFLGPFLAPAFFVSSQVATSPEEAHDLLPSEHVLALQLGNAYLLLGFLGLFILNTTDELKTVKAYLAALWLGDIGHIAVTAWAMGWDGVADVGSWTAVAWGNIAVTAGLFAVRSLYFLGCFGEGSSVRAKKEL
ncbi:uncharacterized protein K452DRAFT_294796 [Aplosporella prunicola CBS 121167]|uniref:DUF7704 domain-containing protein n=1 Tax=Aplosporella prunicola CBS 121167 TaxID=1176127 RepID=A0A6A6BPZ0_9PEZI|nr:uncharacterized protein K452DRAFT_294796 [Aplosporella prunicola CBS 121167]KAF2146209.1 hypothetical protein K452DRAFT_294796 [Aplosporella prunicola CBS 121167]